MPFAQTQSIKLFPLNPKIKPTLLIALAILVLLGSLALIQKAITGVVEEKLPEVMKIYDAETGQFPDYRVFAFKNWVSTESGTQVSYVVTLQSNRQATTDEMRQAGKTACATGLPEGTIVTVSARKQYWILPFYTAYSISGICPKAQ